MRYGNTTPTRFGRALRHAVLAIAIASYLPAHPAAAQTSVPEEAVSYNIPAGDLVAALDMFSKQSGIQLLYRLDLVTGKKSPAVSGQLKPSAALARLLEGAGIVFERANESTFALKRAAPRPAPVPAEPPKPAARSSAGADEEAKDLPTVVVRKPFTDANVDIVRTENDAQPYYIFGAEEIAKANTVNLEDFLKQKLTMNTVGRTSSSFSYSGATTSTVNLRGLGANQTLILVNGRRTGGSNDPQFDLNAFSPSMVERIEVLPSSASAIYGGSAVGGIINIILRRDFTGGDVQLSYDTPLDEHAPARSLSAGYGWSLEDGRTNITLSASYRDNDPLLLGDRPEFLRGHRNILERAPGLLYSANSPLWFGTTSNIASVDGSPLTFKNAGPLAGASLGSSLTYVPAGTSFATSLADLQAGLLGNAGQQNTTHPDTNVWGVLPGLRRAFEPTTKALSLSGAVRRKMTDRLELFTEVFYNSNEGRNATGPDVFPRVPASAPTNPFQQDVWVYTPVSDGFGLAVSKRESLRVVAGFVLDLPNDWRAQGDYTWNRTKTSLWHERFDYASAGEASAAAFADGTLNPFVDVLAYGLDQFAPYMTSADRVLREPTNTLADIGLRVSGPVGSLPAGQPNLTVGLGHREEKLHSYVYDQAGYGRYTYFPLSQSISSLYAEALVPLVAPVNAIPGVRLFDLQFASRVEDFSVDTGTPFRITYPPDYAANPNEVLLREKVDYRVTTTTAGFRYKPVDSLTLRASRATAFLPPNFNQLLPNPVQPLNLSSGTWGDPKRGGELIFGTRLTGGNPDLQPMDARTLNVGLLFEPAFLKGLRAGVEWFRLERENLIFSPSIPFLLANEEVFADRITRAPAAPGDPYGVGPVTQVDARVLNVKHVSMEGFDLSLGYSRDSERHGVFSVDLLATIVDSFTRVLTPVSPEEDVAGRVNEDGGPLKVRANATFGWERGPWSLGWTVLYYGHYDQWRDDPLLIAAQGGTTVPHQVYHNLLAGYRFGDGGTSGMMRALSDVTVTLGVRNVFNRVPPIDVYWYTDANISPFGDYRLRSVQLSVGKRF